MLENPLGEAIAATEGESAYDAQAKLLLGNKTILSHILKECVSEFKDYSCEYIEQFCIEGDPRIGTEPVERFERGKNIVGMNTEDTTSTEGTQYFDIRFYATLPESDETIGLIINVEAQNKFDPGYSLVRRGLYYCSRMISGQHNTIFEHEDYNRIKKVYSIWICPSAPDERADTITKYYIAEECVKGQSKTELQHYDLMNLILICFNDKDNSDGLNRFLKVLLSNSFTSKEKHLILTDEYNVKFTDDLERGIDRMCNLSAGVLEKGKEIARDEMIRTMLLENELPIEKIAKYAKSTVEEVKKILADMKTE